MVLVGLAAIDRGDRIVDALDNELDVVGLRQAQRRLAQLIGGNVVVGDEDAVGLERGRPGEDDLTMKQTMVDAEQSDHDDSFRSDSTGVLPFARNGRCDIV